MNVPTGFSRSEWRLVVASGVTCLAQEVGAIDNFRLMRYDIVFRDKYHSKAEINRL